MLGIQLSALSMPELRRLLELARARGQAGLVRELEAELAGRLGGAIGSQPPAMAPTPPARRTRGPAVAVAGLAAFIGATVAWDLSPDAPRPPRPQPVALVASSPAPRVAVALTTTVLPEEAPTQPTEEPAAPALEVSYTERTRPAPRDNPCLDLPTAHERLVCGYPSLAIQDRRMKAALERARTDSRDPDALDSAQAAWQRASTNIMDRQVLADRYARRISELESY